MITTDKNNTYSGFWPMTKENTYYGFYDKLREKWYWYKTKKSAIKNILNPYGWICRATLIKDTMYINNRYAKQGGW